VFSLSVVAIAFRSGFSNSHKSESSILCLSRSNAARVCALASQLLSCWVVRYVREQAACLLFLPIAIDRYSFIGDEQQSGSTVFFSNLWTHLLELTAQSLYRLVRWFGSSVERE
jgi:hypothetical protein